MFDFGLPAFFEILGKPQQDVLKSMASPKSYRDGQSLHAHGDPVRTMGWIETGGVFFGKFLRNDGFHSLARLGPGHHFGEFAALPNPTGHTITRRLAAIADGPTVINEIPVDEVIPIFKEDPEYLRAFHFVTTSRLALLLEIYDDARRLPARQRIINFLAIIQRMQPAGKNTIDCTQADISRQLGLSKVTVNQTLRKLMEMDILSLGYGTISFKDPERLEEQTDRG